MTPTGDKIKDLCNAYEQEFRDIGRYDVFDCLITHEYSKLAELLEKHESPELKNLISRFVAAETAIAAKYEVESKYNKEMPIGRRLRAWAR